MLMPCTSAADIGNVFAIISRVLEPPLQQHLGPQCGNELSAATEFAFPVAQRAAPSDIATELAHKYSLHASI